MWGLLLTPPDFISLTHVKNQKKQTQQKLLIKNNYISNVYFSNFWVYITSERVTTEKWGDCYGR